MKRLQFSSAFRSCPPDFWRSLYYIDNKVFRVYCSAESKKYSVRASKRGIYKQIGDKPSHLISKPNPRLKKNTGKSIMVTCVISYEGVVLTHMTSGYFSSTNANMVYRALSAKIGHDFLLLEDNDPVFKSRVCKAEKRRLGIHPVCIPPRSPSLNPLDFCVWADMNKRITNSNRRFLSESRKNYLDRLRQSINSTSPDLIRKAIDSMNNRVMTMYENRGEVFRD